MLYADTSRIYNNSFENPLLIAEKRAHQDIIIYTQKQPSRWNEQKIIKLIGMENVKTILHPENTEGGKIESISLGKAARRRSRNKK